MNKTQNLLSYEYFKLSFVSNLFMFGFELNDKWRINHDNGFSHGK